MDEAWTGMISTLSTNHRQAKKAGIPYGTVILSTPNKTIGRGKWFYERYCSAVAKTDIFKDFIIHWKDVKELAEDPEWYETQRRLAGNDEKKIMQELDLKFLSGQGSFFDEKTIISLQNNTVDPIEKSKIFGGEIWVFQKPIQGKFYLIGVDTASEYGGDFSAITVWDYETLEQVWEYHTKCKVMDFSKIVKLACSTYPGCCVIETTCGYGNNVAEEIDNSEYMIMLYKEKVAGAVNPRVTTSKTQGSQMRRGLSNNSKTRPLIIDSLYSYITEFPEIVKSKRLALELIGLTEKKGRVEADIGSKDDLALATGCAFYVRKWDPPLVLQHSVEYESVFSDIIGMNEDVYSGEMDNDKLIKDIKEHLDEHQGFVDILSLYNQE
jgi:hypothetical protein